MPREVVQPVSWAERHERFRQPQASQTPRRRLVQRTLAQTGRPAPVGQLRANRPLPGRHAGSPVPVRSGRRRGLGRFWRRLFGFLTLLVVVGGGIGFALTSSTFHVQQVNISGTQNPGLIAAIRHVGIQGQDIFLLNSSALIARIEALPLVASASLGISLPNSVTVAIQERAPVLLWQSGKNAYGVAQDGMVVAPLSQLSGGDRLAMVIDKRRAARVRPGTRLNAADVAFAQQVFAQLPGIEGVAPFTLQYVDSITLGGQSEPANQAGSGSYVVVSTSGWLAYLGDAANSNSLANRLQELQQILNIARQQRLQLATIDLRFGLRPVYTLKS
jgi:cell division septal protein FtsQ